MCKKITFYKNNGTFSFFKILEMYTINKLKIRKLINKNKNVY